MYTIQTGIQLHKRKRISVIVDEHDIVHWHGTSVVEALAWVFEKGEDQCAISDDVHTFDIRMDLVPI